MEENHPLTTAIHAAIGEATGEAFGPARRAPTGGGCISETLTVDDGRRRFFVKVGPHPFAEAFRVEAEALSALAAPEAVRVPAPIAQGEAAGRAFLVLEYLRLAERPSAQAYHRLGEQLAALHATTAAAFGWQCDNFIGATPQPNRWHDDWVPFYRDERLHPQLERAQSNGAGKRLIERGHRLAAEFGALFADYAPAASLLHGDLWGGNAAITESGEPVVYDPATYFGDRETDLAMTELFGGFPRPFYAAYDGAWPRHSGYPVRRDLYQLYHVLNHFNLFGGAFGHHAERLTERLLAELGH